MQKRLSGTLNSEIESFIFDGFKQHDIEMIGETGVDAPIYIAICDETGNLLSAVVYQLFWGVLHVKYVYTRKEQRKKGYATQLMKEALTFAKQQRCPFAFVETMSFQALPFYQSLGFTIDFKRQGFSHGSSFYYLRKELEI